MYQTQSWYLERNRYNAPLRHTEILKVDVTQWSTKGIGQPSLFAAVGPFESQRCSSAAPPVLGFEQCGAILKRGFPICNFVRTRYFSEDVSGITAAVRSSKPQRRVTLAMIKRAALLQFRRNNAGFARRELKAAPQLARCANRPRITKPRPPRPMKGTGRFIAVKPGAFKGDRLLAACNASGTDDLNTLQDLRMMMVHGILLERTHHRIVAAKRNEPASSG